MRLSFSGDALNAAAAAAAAGASVGLVTAVGDDELGERIIRFAHDRGIDTTYVDRRPEPNGIYFASADPGGAREFVYVRRGSAASTIGPDDVLRAPLDEAGALVGGRHHPGALGLLRRGRRRGGHDRQRAPAGRSSSTRTSATA